MDKLTHVIGPAPHERTFPSLLELLKHERQRISDVLQRNRVKPKRASSGTKTKRVPKAKSRMDDAQLRMISEATGVSIEDLKRGG